MGVMTPARLPAKKCHDTLMTVTGKGTTRQTVRIDATLWKRFGAACDEQGTDRSAVMRAMIDRFLHDPVAVLTELAQESAAAESED